MTTSFANAGLNREPFCPKVLICCLSRINKDGMFNYLVLRNLFADWPRECLAQIYSRGSDDDEGFCKYQYQIAASGRQFGKLFFKFKGAYAMDSLSTCPVEPKVATPRNNSPLTFVKSADGRFLMDSGLYEMIFKLRPSQQRFDWAE